MSTEDEYLQQWIISTLTAHPTAGLDVEGIISYIDYKDHSLYNEGEVNIALNQLQKKGSVLERDGKWFSKENSLLEE